MATTYIEPKILKGFRDFLPSAEIVRRGLIEKIENTFRSFGFVPIDTPALEYAEICLARAAEKRKNKSTVLRTMESGMSLFVLI